MNGIFFFLCALSLILCLLNSPEKTLPAMLNGANKSLTLIFTLAGIYCVWLGVYKLLERSNITSFIAKGLSKPVKKLFKSKDEKLTNTIAVNLAANMLGLGGIATPLGILACSELEKENNLQSAKLLVIISCTSIQLIPTSVLALLSSYGAEKCENIILPSLICTIFSTTVGVFLFFLTKNIKLKKKKKGSKG